MGRKSVIRVRAQDRRARQLPCDRVRRLARQLVEAATLDDDGAELGRLAGIASLDRQLAGTVIGILARTALDLGARVAWLEAGDGS